MLLIIFIISIIIIVTILYVVYNKKAQLTQPDAHTEKLILQQHVLFYQRLTDEEKIRFEENLRKFLQKVRITGVKTNVENIDRVFVAAAAIIPIFAFEGWEYKNIHEVLLYPGSFNEDYQIEGQERDLLGMVGYGPLQNVMILSQHDLRRGFLNGLKCSLND